MNNLPLDIKNIVNNYKYQLEHITKFKSTLEIIKKIIPDCYFMWAYGIGIEWNNYDKENDIITKRYKQIHLCNRCYNIREHPYKGGTPDYCDCGIHDKHPPDGWMEFEYGW